MAALHNMLKNGQKFSVSISNTVTNRRLLLDDINEEFMNMALS